MLIINIIIWFLICTSLTVMHICMDFPHLYCIFGVHWDEICGLVSLTRFTNVLSIILEYLSSPSSFLCPSWTLMAGTFNLSVMFHGPLRFASIFGLFSLSCQGLVIVFALQAFCFFPLFFPFYFEKAHRIVRAQWFNF